MGLGLGLRQGQRPILGGDRVINKCQKIKSTVLKGFENDVDVRASRYTCRRVHLNTDQLEVLKFT